MPWPVFNNYFGKQRKKFIEKQAKISVQKKRICPFSHSECPILLRVQALFTMSEKQECRPVSLQNIKIVQIFETEQKNRTKNKILSVINQNHIFPFFYNSG